MVFFTTLSIQAIMSSLSIECFLTTAPRILNDRPISYLEQTCVSLCDAGFNPVVFAEPHSELPRHVPTKQTFIRQTKLGAWHNWKDAVLTILAMSDADYFLSCQDDIALHPESKQLIHRFIEWIDFKPFGYFSLYTPTHYTIAGGPRPKPKGFTQMDVPAAYGACCLLIPRKVLENMVKTNIWAKWLGVPAVNDPIGEFQKRRENPTIVKHVDAAITQMLVELKLPLFYPVPSAVQHIGEYSALGHAHCPIPEPGAPVVSRRVAQNIVDFNKPLLPQIFPGA